MITLSILNVNHVNKVTNLRDIMRFEIEHELNLSNKEHIFSSHVFTSFLNDLKNKTFNIADSVNRDNVNEENLLKTQLTSDSSVKHRAQ